MFLGHFAVGLGTKKATPKVSLGTLFLAAQLVDLLWPLLLLVGLEHVRIDPGNTAVTPLDFYDYPISHSLIGAIGWSVVMGLAYFLIKRERRIAVILGLVVFSHWILDLLTHRPDLSLGLGGSVYFGMGLWNSVAATLVLELGLYALGVWLYLSSTTARDKIGTYGAWGLIVVLFLIYVSNIVGPPPPSAEAIGVVGNAGWLFILWAYWIDRHRMPKAASAPSPAT